MATPAFPTFDSAKPDWGPQTGTALAQSIRDNEFGLLLMQFLGGGALPGGWSKSSTVDASGRVTQLIASAGALRFKVDLTYVAASGADYWKLAVRTVTWSNDAGVTYASAPGSGTYTYGANSAVSFTPT